SMLWISIPSEGGCLTSVRIYFDPVFAFIVKRFRVFVRRFIYATMTTIAATIVSQLDSAMTDSTNFAVKTLAEVGLVLMVITLLTNVAARGMVRRVSRTALPVGRGI
ncbi:hypothetical protein ABLN79_21095, partial [Mycobacterium tuberculosis]